MRIVKLTYSRTRGGGEVTVEFSDGTSLAVLPDLAVKYRLKEGGALGDRVREEMLAENQMLMARQRLVRYLALRRKTEREALAYLARLGFEEEAARGAVEHARGLGFVNDAQFAEAFARTRERTAKLGPRAVKFELSGRGVAREIAAQAVAPSEPVEVQRENARRAGERKARALADEEPAKARQKLSAFLMRKGYDSEVAFEVARELLKKK